MTDAPLLSILIPSFNQASFLPRALDSALAQTYRPLEVIVVDGASTDGTVEILQDYAARHPEVRYVSEKDDGPADAVNKALALARGSIGGIHSSDDIYYPGAFDEAMRVLARHPESDMVYGHYRIIDVDDRPTATQHAETFSWERYFSHNLGLQQGSIFFRIDLARRLGGWDPDLYSPDAYLWLRMLLHTTPVRIDRVLSGWRRHDEQRTRADRYKAIFEDYGRMIDGCEDLRRAPRRVRRLADASRHLMVLLFDPGSNPWFVRRQLLLALPKHPTFWRYYPRERMLGLFLPGYWRLTQALHRS